MEITCPITLEVIDDETSIHRSRGGTIYQMDALKIWMNIQNRSSGVIYYPTREPITVENAISLGLISQEIPSNMNIVCDVIPENISDMLISWLDCFQSFKEDAENGTVLTVQTYDVDFHDDSINYIRGFMNYNNVKNFNRIVEALKRESVLHNIYLNGTIEESLESIDSPNYTTLDWTYRESLLWMLENGFPILNVNHPDLGIYYGGFPTSRDSHIIGIDVPIVTKKATLELIDRFILQIGVEKSCMYLDDSDYSNLSSSTRLHISNYKRSLRRRRRRFRREILGDIC